MFGYFKRNTQILGLIRLEFEVWEGKIAVMSQRIVRMAPADKPKLLDQVRGRHPPQRGIAPRRSSRRTSQSPVGVCAGSRLWIPKGEQSIWIVDAHRDDGRRFVVRVDEILSASLELEPAIRSLGALLSVPS